MSNTTIMSDEQFEEALADANRALSEVRAKFASKRRVFTPEQVMAKHREVDALLTSHIGAEVGEGFVLDGWTIDTDLNAVSRYPLLASLSVNHRDLTDDDEALVWGTYGRDAAEAWVASIGFPRSEVEARFDD